MESVSDPPDVVEWVDAATGEVTRRTPFADLDDEIRYAPGPDGEPVAVARIEMLTVADRREIRQIAADGTVLRTTYQRFEPS